MSTKSTDRKRINWDDEITKISNSKSKEKRFKFKNPNSAGASRYRLLKLWDGLDIRTKGDTMIVKVIG